MTLLIKYDKNFIVFSPLLNFFLVQCWGDRDWRETLNKNNSNNLSALRQKIRRFLKQEPLEKEINAYREVCPHTKICSKDTNFSVLQKPDVGDEELPIDEVPSAEQSADSEEDQEEVAPTKSKPQDVNEQFLRGKSLY